MKDSILSLLQTVKLIHNVSQFYNTPERISSLMIKVSNIFALTPNFDSSVLRNVEKIQKFERFSIFLLF